MGCLDGLLRWKSIYPGKMLYQEYGINGKGILSKLMSTLTNKKSFIYDFSIFVNFVISSVTEETYYFSRWYSSEFLLWIIFGLTQTITFVKNVCFIANYLFSLQFSYYLVITPLSYTLTLIEQSSLFVLGNKYFSQMC